jgi:hypothetical protein
MSNGAAPPCPAAADTDPQVVSNPPGLAQISYRVDDFTGFRRALLRPLPGEQAIGTWRPAAGDLGLQVLEWWAYLADILTFYNERIANESYLRTAVLPASVANLVALLGYAPAPGIAATGNVAAVRSPARPAEPLVIPAGLRLSSVATPGVPAQAFEASAAASFPGPSSVPVTLPAVPAPLNAGSTPQSVLLAGAVSGVRPGDQLLLVETGFSGGDDNWSLVTVSALTPAPDPVTRAINTLVTISLAGWGPASGLTFAAELALAFAQLPPPDVTGPGPSVPSTGYRLMRPAGAAALWNQSTAPSSEPTFAAPTTTSPLVAHLSAAVRAITPGDLVLFDGGAGYYSALGLVTGTSEPFYTIPYPGTSGPPPPELVITHTALAVALTAADAGVLAQGQAPVAEITVRYGFKDVGTIIGIPAATLPSLPATVGVPATYTPAAPVTAFLQDTTGAGVLVTVTSTATGQVTLTGAGAPPAQLTAALQVPLQLLLDVVPVSRGTTVTGEVLGSGNAALINHSFTLARSPLTYLASGAGVASTLTVYVSGAAWQEVPSFFGQAPGARVFVVSRSPDQSVTTVTFGDGVNGARLPSGTGSVTATYRYGSGAASPPAGRLTTIGQPQPNLASIQNPVAVAGGADPQAPDDVRADAPASVFAFGRAISAVDYEVVAAQAPGVTRAAAAWTFDQALQRTLVILYVDGDQAVQAASAALAGAEDPNRPVSVRAATAIDLTLSCTLVVAAGQQVPAVVSAAAAAVSDAAGGLFSPAQLAIGQRLYRSALDEALLVPGVAAVHDLVVSGPGGSSGPVLLGEYLDPGPGSFFDLPAGSITIVGVSSGD